MNAHVSGITLGVRDLNRAKQFYSEGPGWSILVRSEERVDAVLAEAERAGGKIAKPAQRAPVGWMRRLLHRSGRLSTESRVRHRSTAVRRIATLRAANAAIRVKAASGVRRPTAQPA
jgi:predicted enzyme related to lactoylglutathione lyase